MSALYSAALKDQHPVQLRAHPAQASTGTTSNFGLPAPSGPLNAPPGPLLPRAGGSSPPGDGNAAAAYLDLLASTTPGLRVAAGQEIGLEGSTGNSTGPHPHFEVHQDSHQNPIEPTGWLREHGVTIPGCAPLAVPAEPPV